MYYPAVDKDGITADFAAGLAAAPFPQWAGLSVTPVVLDDQDKHVRARVGVGARKTLPAACRRALHVYEGR